MKRSLPKQFWALTASHLIFVLGIQPSLALWANSENGTFVDLILKDPSHPQYRLLKKIVPSILKIETPHRGQLPDMFRVRDFSPDNDIQQAIAGVNEAFKQAISVFYPSTGVVISSPQDQQIFVSGWKQFQVGALKDNRGFAGFYGEPTTSPFWVEASQSPQGLFDSFFIGTPPKGNVFFTNHITLRESNENNFRYLHPSKDFIIGAVPMDANSKNFSSVQVGKAKEGEAVICVGFSQQFQKLNSQSPSHPDADSNKFQLVSMRLAVNTGEVLSHLEARKLIEREGSPLAYDPESEFVITLPNHRFLNQGRHGSPVFNSEGVLLGILVANIQLSDGEVGAFRIVKIEHIINSLVEAYSATHGKAKDKLLTTKSCLIDLGILGAH